MWCEKNEHLDTTILVVVQYWLNKCAKKGLLWNLVQGIDKPDIIAYGIMEFLRAAPRLKQKLQTADHSGNAPRIGSSLKGSSALGSAVLQRVTESNQAEAILVVVAPDLGREP